jgi:phage shock protein C
MNANEYQDATASTGRAAPGEEHDPISGDRGPAPAKDLWGQTVRLLQLWMDEAWRLLSGRRDGAASYGDHAAGVERRGVSLMGRRLYRSRRDRLVRGVCAGLADYLGIPAALVRIAFVVLFLTGVFHAVIPYVLLAILVPEAPYEEVSPR